nr:tyrosine-protein kinase domain-containing protein [Grimontia sedimenti]
MIHAMAQYNAIKQRSDKFLTQLANGIEKELQSARELESALRREMRDKKDEFQGIAVKRARYDVLKREVKTNRDLYDLFLTRQKETTATSDFTPVNARFTDEALQPLTPSKPKKKLIIVLASLMGLMVSVAFALLIEAFKQTFEKPEDVEERLGVAPLGTVPMLKGRKFKKNGISPSVFFEDSNAGFSEAFRQIRTSLLLNQAYQSRKLIAIASSMPSEGKTTSAINIATSLATMEKVLIIDADLRKPSLMTRFGAPQSQSGLTHHLLMNQDLESCIFHDEVSKVDVLPAGMIPPNPLEVLSSQAFKVLVDKLTLKYDRIIIDTPPTLLFSDSLVVGDICGGAIIVVKANQTRTEQVQKTIGKFIHHKINLDGIVLNRVSKKQSQSSAYYGEYGSYYGAKS